ITAAAASQLVFTTQPSNVLLGQSINGSTGVQVSIEDSFGNVVTSDSSTVTVALGSAPGTGALSSTTAVAASSGIATFTTLSINQAGAGYTLAAADGGLSGATSTPFTVRTAVYYTVTTLQDNTTGTVSGGPGDMIGDAYQATTLRAAINAANLDN